MNFSLLAALSLLLTITAPARAGTSLVDDRAKLEAANDTFAKVFPYYFEVCGVTQFLPVEKGNDGGEYGHTVMYLRGACRDTSAPYPRLKFCGEGKGVAISEDSDFANVSWTAVDSRSFMFYGDLPADSPVTSREMDASINSAVQQHIFKNVKLLENHDSKVRRGETYEHMVARWSLGTGFAVNFARTAYCTRVPMIPNKGPKESMVMALISYFNNLNQDAYKNGFVYDGLGNNCTHLAHNALATVGYWPAKATGWPSAGLGVLGHIKDLSVPFNTMMDSLEKGIGDANTLNPARFADAPQERAGLDKFDWVGAQPGVTMEVLPILAAHNEQFKTTAKPFLLDIKAALLDRVNVKSDNVAAAAFTKAVTDPRIADLSANLNYWQKKYARDARVSFDRGSYPDIAPAMRSYLNFQQTNVVEKLNKLEELEHPAAPAPAPTQAATETQ
ncbi:MAG: hypothetical protein ACXWSC_00005 [Bdellovibrionota bacterium]